MEILKGGVAHDSFEDVQALTNKIVTDAEWLSEGNVDVLNVSARCKVKALFIQMTHVFCIGSHTVLESISKHNRSSDIIYRGS